MSQDQHPDGVVSPVEVIFDALAASFREALTVPRYVPSRSDRIAAEHAETCGHCHLIPKSALDPGNPLRGKATDWIVHLTPRRETRPRGVLE